MLKIIIKCGSRSDAANLRNKFDDLFGPRSLLEESTLLVKLHLSEFSALVDKKPMDIENLAALRFLNED